MVEDVEFERGEFLELREIRDWFSDRYPAFSEGSVERHARMMTTNLKERRRSSASKDGDEKYNLFFEEKRKFRLYDSENDPEPLPFGK